MSGAPLLLTVQDTLIVVGIVLGVDTVTYGGVPHSVGIGMIADEIFDLNSQIFGGRLASSLGLTAAALRHS